MNRRIFNTNMFKILVLLTFISLGLTNDERPNENEHITKLSLSNKGITSLNDYDFSKYPQLEELDLSNNLIENIKEDKFTKNHNLKKLNLSGNKRLKLPEFSTLLISDIEELNLSSCNIEVFPAPILDGLINLKVIDLSGNPLSTVKLITFTNLLSPKKIILPNLDDKKTITEICNELNITIEDTENILQCSNVRNNKWDLEKKHPSTNINIPKVSNTQEINNDQQKQTATNLDANEIQPEVPEDTNKSQEKKNNKNELIDTTEINDEPKANETVNANPRNTNKLEEEPDNAHLDNDLLDTDDYISGEDDVIDTEPEVPDIESKDPPIEKSVSNNETLLTTVTHNKTLDTVDEPQLKVNNTNDIQTSETQDNIKQTDTQSETKQPQNNTSEVPVTTNPDSVNATKAIVVSEQTLPNINDTLKDDLLVKPIPRSIPASPIQNQDMPKSIPDKISFSDGSIQPQVTSSENHVNQKEKQSQQEKQDTSEAPTGATTQPTTGTNILIFLVVAVIISGIAAFGYRFYKSRTYRATNTHEPIERELQEIVTDKKTNGPTLSDVLEEEPLMQKTENSVEIKEVDTTENNNSSDVNHTSTNSKPYVPITSIENVTPNDK